MNASPRTGRGAGTGSCSELDAGDFGEWPGLVDGAGDDHAEVDFRGFVEARAAFDGGEF